MNTEQDGYFDLGSITDYSAFLKAKYGKSKLIKGHPLLEDIDGFVGNAKRLSEDSKPGFSQMRKRVHLRSILKYMEMAFEEFDTEGIQGVAEIFRKAVQEDFNCYKPSDYFHHKVQEAWNELDLSAPDVSDEEEFAGKYLPDPPTVPAIDECLEANGCKTPKNQSNESRHELIRRALNDLGLPFTHGPRSKYKK